MIAALAGLLVCQLLGEVAVRAFGLPVPGPLGGLGLMFTFLVWRGRRGDVAVPAELGRVADAFMRNLSVLFVPAAVGIVQYLALLGRFIRPICITIVVSTTITLVVTVLTFRLVSRLHASRHKPALDGAEPISDPERPR